MILLNFSVQRAARSFSRSLAGLSDQTLGISRVAAERHEAAQVGTSAEFALAFAITANRSLTIMLNEVYLALAKTPIEGPAGVEASFDFSAAFNATATRMMTAVLRNQQAGTEYA